MPRVEETTEEPAPQTYREALERLAGGSQRGMRLGLESTRELCRRLGDPQVGLPGVLVAGTNGKGSVCAMVDSIARRAGLRVALLTKPHLTSYRERLQLGGEPIGEAGFVAVAEPVIEAAEAMARSSARPTHHELLTAMGFLAARRWGAELVVCEVGLGGRLDATNIWDGGIAVLVSVGLDHQAQLGNTIPEIAREKAAIVKPGNLVVSGAGAEAQPPLRAAVARNGARLWQLGEEIRLDSRPGDPTFDVTTPAGRLAGLCLGLEGQLQRPNAALAVAVGDCLRERGFPIGEAALRSGLDGVSWPGRLQQLASAPPVLVDAAHNPAAVAAVLPELARRCRERRTVLLFGSMTDHDHGGMLEQLSGAGFAAAVFTRARSERAAAAELVAASWAGDAEVRQPVAAALARARGWAGEGGLVVALGSIYVVGEVMAALGEGLAPDPEVPQSPLW